MNRLCQTLAARAALDVEINHVLSLLAGREELDDRPDRATLALVRQVLHLDEPGDRPELASDIDAAERNLIEIYLGRTEKALQRFVSAAQAPKEPK